MNVYKIPVRGYFEVNSYFLIDEDTGHGFLIDPGAQGNEIARIIQSKVWTIEKILLTHGHFDHTGGIEALQRQLGLPVYIHENGAAYLSDTRLNLSAVCGEHKYSNEAPGRFTIPGAVIYQFLSRFTQHREPWAFPSDMVPDWINPKYSAGDLLRNAILDVQYRPAEPAAPEQIGMEI